MPLFAHARIEDPDNAGRFFERGESVPEDVAERLGNGDEGFTAVRPEAYDPAADANAPPQYVEIDGVRYERKEEPDAA